MKYMNIVTDEIKNKKMKKIEELAIAFVQSTSDPEDSDHGKSVAVDLLVSFYDWVANHPTTEISKEEKQKIFDDGYVRGCEEYEQKMKDSVSEISEGEIEQIEKKFHTFASNHVNLRKETRDKLFTWIKESLLSKGAKDYKAMYDEISQSEWFKTAYENGSLELPDGAKVKTPPREKRINGIRLTANSINETASVFLSLSDGTEVEFIKANGESIDHWKSIKQLNS